MNFVATARTLGLMILLTAGTTGAQELVGRGEWQSLSGGDHLKGTWTVRLQRNGTSLDGTMELSGSNVFSGGPVQGNIDGQSIVLGVSSDGVTAATFAGKLTGDSIGGEWECPAVNDKGVWQGTLSRKNSN
jgi:hypothetical protein